MYVACICMSHSHAIRDSRPRQQNKSAFFWFCVHLIMNISRILKEKAGHQGNCLSAETSFHVFAWIHMDIHVPA